MSRKINLALFSLLALYPSAASALGENNTRLQYLLKRARSRSTTYHQSKAAPSKVIPQEQVQVEVPPHPVLVPEKIEHHTPAPPVEETHHQEVEHQETKHHAQAHHQERAPRVLETHPHKEEPKPPVQPSPAPIVHKRETQVHVQTEHKVVQPPVQTHIGHESSSIHTEVQSNSTIHSSSQEHHETHEVEQEEEETVEHKAYDEVAVFLNQVLGGGEEEQVAEPIPAAPVLDEEPIETLAAQPEEELTEENSQALNLSDKESDYLLIIRKSLKSLEDDPWVKVKNNMDEAIAYFEKENKLGTDEDVDVYQKIVLACKRFSEGGLELDEGDFADFEEAEALYLDTKDLLEQAKKTVHKKTDYKNTQINEIIDALLGYTQEELQYIEEMLGM